MVTYVRNQLRDIVKLMRIIIFLKNKIYNNIYFNNIYILQFLLWLYLYQKVMVCDFCVSYGALVHV